MCINSAAQFSAYPTCLIILRLGFWRAFVGAGRRPWIFQMMELGMQINHVMSIGYIFALSGGPPTLRVSLPSFNPSPCVLFLLLIIHNFAESVSFIPVSTQPKRSCRRTLMQCKTSSILEKCMCANDLMQCKTSCIGERCMCQKDFMQCKTSCIVSVKSM